jgi:hypothetical protein
MTSINRLAQALGYVKLAKQSLEPTAEFYEAYALEKLSEVESALITGITDIVKGGDVPAPTQSPRQLTRDDIIEMAKRDVAELKDSYDGRYYLIDIYRCYADFKINREKRTVVALLRGARSKKVYARGIAKCHPDDCFNAHIGRAIALRRALGLEVPDEYLNAPQPTEVRVGDIVEITYDDGSKEVFEVGEVDYDVLDNEQPWVSDKDQPWSGCNFDFKTDRVIDDTRDNGVGDSIV